MELVNAIYAFEHKEQHSGVVREALETVVRLLTPFVPHIAEELWSNALGNEDRLSTGQWPEWDEAALVEDQKLIVIQVNGKVRGKVTVPADISEDDLKQTALNDPNVIRFIGDKTVRKVIVVPGRLVNVVVA
jgi:leucyl-tRNA synthetase